MARDREEPELGSAEALPGRDQDVALADVLAARTDVRARAPGRRATGRAPRPRRPRSRSARSTSAPAGIGAPVAMCIVSPAPTVPSGSWPINARPTIFSSRGLRGRRPGDVGGAHGEPVHRRGGELGQVVRRDDVLGHHAAVRVGQRQPERRERLDAGEHALPRLLDGEQPLGRVVVVDVGLRRHGGQCRRGPRRATLS